MNPVRQKLNQLSKQKKDTDKSRLFTKEDLMEAYCEFCHYFGYMELEHFLKIKIPQFWVMIAWIQEKKKKDYETMMAMLGATKKDG